MMGAEEHVTLQPALVLKLSESFSRASNNMQTDVKPYRSPITCSTNGPNLSIN